MNLAIQPPFAPMEAQSVAKLPETGEWQFEPKWDGFRCVAFKDGDEIELQSKSCQTLTRYFPEVVVALRAVDAHRFVLDSELVIRLNGEPSFDALLQRIHPADSRVRKLAAETPATMVAFDLIVDAENTPLIDRPLRERRALLEEFHSRHVAHRTNIELSPTTSSVAEASHWLETSGGSLDGLMAKALGSPYLSGERSGMNKFKLAHTVDCVIGGFRYGTNGKLVGSLLLGLYDDQGLLHHCGFVAAIRNAEKEELTRKLEALVEAPGFTGRAPSGPSRWSQGRSMEWEPLKPELVVEVTYEHMTGGRFRSGALVKRWRPEKDPRECTFAQLRVAPAQLRKGC
jgi:ATP-dependent DNA ligase